MGVKWVNYVIRIIIMRIYCLKGLFLRGIEGRSASLLTLDDEYESDHNIRPHQLYLRLF